MKNNTKNKPLSTKKSSRGHFEEIMESFALNKSKPHQPKFHVEPDRLGWRIFDGEKALALFTPMWFDIWSFSPFEPDEMANVEPPVNVVDLHTVHNTYINLGMQTWPPHWHKQGDFENRVKLDWLKKSGEELVARITAEFADGESGEWLVRVSYDPAWGRYRYTWEIDVRKYGADSMEAFNLMTAGALAERPEKRRWTHSLWENTDGELRRIVHSNALFQCTDYGNSQDPGGPWRSRNLPYPRAWMAYAAHPSFNPAILIHTTNVPLLGMTCDQLFDEHIVWNRAGQDNLGEDGYFHFHMNLEFVSLPPTQASELLGQAADPVRPKKWKNEKVALPFRLDVANSFEMAVDPWLPEECPIFQVPLAVDGPVAWVDETAYSGSHSLRLRQKEAGRLHAFPTGAVCRVLPHARYRLSAWVKTHEIANNAKLELAGYAYSYDNISHQAESSRLSGDVDWTHLDVELESDGQAYLMPYLVLEGPGTAWFDDVKLERIF